MVTKYRNTGKKIKAKDKPRDLEDRFLDFFLRVIRLSKKCPLNARTSRIISQLTACSGSMPANFAEASKAMSKKDFNKSIKITSKEAKESKIWIRGLKEAVDFEDEEFDLLIQKASEFIYILTSILKITDSKN